MATRESSSTGATRGLEVPVGANWTGVGATRDGAVVLQLTERVESVLHEDLGHLMLSTSSHMVVGGSREVAYASAAALHASPVVCVELAVFTYWTVLLNCRRARGHDSAHMAK